MGGESPSRDRWVVNLLVGTGRMVIGESPSRDRWGGEFTGGEALYASSTHK